MLLTVGGHCLVEICLQAISLPFDVLLTTYDIALMDQEFLSQIPWQYAIVDEAQRLKNPSSVCLTIWEICKIICKQHLIMSMAACSRLERSNGWVWERDLHRKDVWLRPAYSKYQCAIFLLWMGLGEKVWCPTFQPIWAGLLHRHCIACFFAEYCLTFNILDLVTLPFLHYG